LIISVWSEKTKVTQEVLCYIYEEKDCISHNVARTKETENNDA